MTKKQRFRAPRFDKADAEKLAASIGCSGAHQDSEGKWLPCASEEEMQRLSNEAEPEKKPVGFYDKKEGKPKRKKRGKRKRYVNDEWENLRQRAPLGFDSLPGGGIVSGNNPPIPAVGETVTAFGGGTIPGITNTGIKSALGASIGERAGGSSSSGSARDGVDRDGDGVINDGTEDERPSKKKKRDERPVPGDGVGPPKPKNRDEMPPGGNAGPPKPKNRDRRPVPGDGVGPPKPKNPRRRDTPIRPIPNAPLQGRDTPARPIPNSPIDSNRDEAARPYNKGKSESVEDVETKARQMVGPEYVRDNDPDVFIDPESARFRSRQLGCIGISRRISKTGRAVWMPCTNMSDYSRVSGSTSLGRRGQRREMENTVRTIVSRELRKNKK
jgi:hypothetical protein